jgi:signal transduction histidine kinase
MSKQKDPPATSIASLAVLGVLLLLVALAIDYYLYVRLSQSFIELNAEQARSLISKYSPILYLAAGAAGALGILFFTVIARLRRAASPPPPPPPAPPPGLVPAKPSAEQIQAEEHRAFLFAEAQTINLAVGKNFLIREANQVAVNLLNHAGEGLKGRDIRDFAEGAGREALVRYLERHLRGEFSPREDIELKTPGGPRIIRFAERHAIIKQDLVPVGILISGLDVTAAKRAEEEMQGLKRRLALAARMETLGLLAGGIAHDLKNIFSPLFAYPDYILKHLPADSPLIPTIQGIQDAARRSSEIILNFLTLARRGKADLTASDLNQIVNFFLDTPDFKELTTRGPTVTVTIDLTRDPVVFQSLPSQVMSALMNLIRNAFEAMSEGGRLSVTTRKVVLDWPHKGFQQIPRGEYAVLTVADQGPGMAPEKIKDLFTPFRSGKEMGRSGSGLGLTVVAGVVEDYRGYIDVVSRLGEGTAFSLYFPAYHPEAPAPAAETQERNP